MLIRNLKELEDFASEFASTLKIGDIICLTGDLGAGKTEFVRKVIQVLSSKDIVVPSPTFTLVQEYETKIGPIFHYDLYRLESPEEILELGIEEAYGQGISFIEWPNRLGPYLPNNRIDIDIKIASNEQRVVSVRRTPLTNPPSAT